jgi:hypothetical protein
MKNLFNLLSRNIVLIISINKIFFQIQKRGFISLSPHYSVMVIILMTLFDQLQRNHHLLLINIYAAWFFAETFENIEEHTEFIQKLHTLLFNLRKI